MQQFPLSSIYLTPKARPNLLYLYEFAFLDRRTINSNLKMGKKRKKKNIRKNEMNFRDIHSIYSRGHKIWAGANFLGYCSCSHWNPPPPPLPDTFYDKFYDKITLMSFHDLMKKLQFPRNFGSSKMQKVRKVQKV